MVIRPAPIGLQQIIAHLAPISVLMYSKVLICALMPSEVLGLSRPKPLYHDWRAVPYHQPLLADPVVMGTWWCALMDAHYHQLRSRPRTAETHFPRPSQSASSPHLIHSLCSTSFPCHFICACRYAVRIAKRARCHWMLGHDWEERHRPQSCSVGWWYRSLRDCVKSSAVSLCTRTVTKRKFLIFEAASLPTCQSARRLGIPPPHRAFVFRDHAHVKLYSLFRVSEAFQGPLVPRSRERTMACGSIRYPARVSKPSNTWETKFNWRVKAGGLSSRTLFEKRWFARN